MSLAGRVLINKALLMILALAGCATDPATEVMLVVKSDLPAAQLQGMRITVARAADKVSLFDNCTCVGDMAGCVAMPARLGIVASSASNSHPFVVTVAAFSDASCSAQVVSQTATLQFFPKRTLELDMSLLNVCRGKVCDPGSTCYDDGQCAIDQRNNLPPFDPRADGGTNGPVARQWAAMAYDPIRKRTVLVGGLGLGDTPLQDTWEWDGTRWTEFQGTVPIKGFRPGMAFDAGKQRLVLYGGNYIDSTLTYDGKAWTTINQGTGPKALMPWLSWDAFRQKLVLFDSDGTVYELDDHDNWQKRTSAHLPTPERTYAGIGQRAATGDTLYFGGHANGSTIGDFWIWNDTDWIASTALGPPRQEGAAIADHLALGVSVLYGDTGTWEWNGSAWKADQIAGPSARRNVQMSYDSDRQVLVLFGGDDGTTQLGETWELGTDRVWIRR